METIPYIERITKLTPKDWDEIFLFVNPALTSFEKEEIKFILSGTKTDISLAKPRLRELGVWNGTGPGFKQLLWKKYTGPLRHLKMLFGYMSVILVDLLRLFLDTVFWFIDSFWHDIEYLIGGSETDRLNADSGLKKYSYMNVAASRRGPIWKKFMYLLANLAYKAVHKFGKYGSFRYSTFGE